MPPGGIVGEVSATESWSARQWGWSNILAELPRIPLPRTPLNRNKRKGRSAWCPDPMICSGRPRPTGRTFYEDATVLGTENSEVLPAGSVAVAVIVCPTATLLAGEKVKETLPDPLVVTDFW